MSNNKGKQRLKKVLQNPDRRDVHFHATGALGDVPTDDYKMRLYETELSNRIARGNASKETVTETTDKKMEELRKQGKITIGSV